MDIWARGAVSTYKTEMFLCFAFFKFMCRSCLDSYLWPPEEFYVLRCNVWYAGDLAWWPDSFCLEWCPRMSQGTLTLIRKLRFSPRSRNHWFEITSQLNTKIWPTWEKKLDLLISHQNHWQKQMGGAKIEMHTGSIRNREAFKHPRRQDSRL